MNSAAFFNIRSSFIALLLFISAPAIASHIAGGQVTYQFIGQSDTCQVSLVIYEDCLNGQPEAIAQDNPAFIGIFDGTGALFLSDDTLTYNSSISLPPFFSNPCGYIGPNTCMLKKTFIGTYVLPPNATGYTVVYQRCCLNANIVNLQNAGNLGMTLTCHIPPSSIRNNSAVFKNDPPQLACITKPFSFDQSATDADGDSLSYGLCAAITGGSSADLKPSPVAPPFDSLTYLTPYSGEAPMDGTPWMQIDPVTGIVTCTPAKIGRYLITVCCHEWRGGALINTITREFQLVVVNCSAGTFDALPWTDTAIYVGATLQFSAFGATSYSWSPATYLSDPTISNPIGHFTDPGFFTYVLHADNAVCSGNDTVFVNVLAHSEFVVPNAFTPNGDNRNDILAPIPVGSATLTDFKIFNRKGDLIFHTNNLANGWDGAYHGVKQDMDTYYWVLYYQDANGVTHKMKGNVMLIR